MSSDSPRQRLLDKLRERGVNEDTLVDNMVDVLNGRSVRDTYRPSKTNPEELVLVERQVVRRHKDMAHGAMVQDALFGGHLGLVPKQVDSTTPSKDLYKRFAPVVDGRIIAIQAPTDTTPGFDILAAARPQPPVLVPVTPPVTDDTVANAMKGIVSPDLPDDDEKF